MFFDFKVGIPEVKGKISEKVIKNVTYINYEYNRIYKPEKRNNIHKRTTIGKRCDNDPGMMYPNMNFMKFFPDTEIPDAAKRTYRSCCLCIGAFLIIQKIIKEYELDDVIRHIIGRDCGLFLDLAAYLIITENNAGQYYPDYAYNHHRFSWKKRHPKIMCLLKR